MTKFKILDTSTAMYSSGGYLPTWSNRGKSWDTLKSVTSALKLYRGKTIPESWVIVEMKLILCEINRTPAKDLIKEEAPVTVKKPKLKKKIFKRKPNKKVVKK